MVKVKETKIKSKLRNLELKEGESLPLALLFISSQQLSHLISPTLIFLHTGFPNEAVVDAYMNPAVDESKEPFSWGLPDLDLLRQYPLLFEEECLIY